MLDSIETEKGRETTVQLFKRESNILHSVIFVPALCGGRGSYVWTRACLFFDEDGKMAGAIESLREMDERRRFDNQLRYLSLHDPLTGIYNRHFFNEEMYRLDRGQFESVGIIVCDIDCLKLVNDTLGHDSGDRLLLEAVSLIKRSCRPNDILARIGGDEFVVLLPNSGKSVVENTCQMIRALIAEYNMNKSDIPLSISLGWDIKNNTAKTMAETLKTADHKMYQDKVANGRKVGGAILPAFVSIIEARGLSSTRDSILLQELVLEIAGLVQFPEYALDRLSLLAKFHDIGYVAIPEQIFFKTEPLTADERAQIRSHCKIGHHIAMSAPALLSIADWILKHHEWWNGEGYPLGLKGEEIPLECRILAIAAAYHAMMSPRPYRKALSQQETLNELEKNAGIQFDPTLVRKFLQNISRKTTSS